MAFDYNNIPSTVAACLSCASAYMIWDNGRQSRARGLEQASTLEDMHDTVAILEKNTNSIKDALVKVTGESEYAKGKLEGKRENV